MAGKSLDDYYAIMKGNPSAVADFRSRLDAIISEGANSTVGQRGPVGAYGLSGGDARPKHFASAYALYGDTVKGVTKQQLEAESKKNPDAFNQKYKGTTYDKLDPDVRKTVDSIRKLNAETKRLGGEPVEEERSFLKKVLDAVSVGGYATAGASKEFQNKQFDIKFLEKQSGKKLSVWEKFKIHAKNEGKVLDSGWEGAKAAFTGNSKRQNYYSDVIQDYYDKDQALKKGVDPDKAIKGSAKVNKGLKYGFGIAADIFLDPTTYITGGGSVVVKAATKGGAATTTARSINETAKSIAAAKTVDTTDATRLLTDALNVHQVTDLKALSGMSMSARSGRKQLTPEGEAYFKVLVDQRKANKALQFNSRTGKLSGGLARKIDTGQKAAVGGATIYKTPLQIIEEIGENSRIAGLARVEAEVGEESAKALAVKLNAIPNIKISDVQARILDDVFTSTRGVPSIDTLSKVYGVKAADIAADMKSLEELGFLTRIGKSGTRYSKAEGGAVSAAKANEVVSILNKAEAAKITKAHAAEYATILAKAKEGVSGSSEVAEELLSIAARNADPTISRSFKIKFAGQEVLEIGNGLVGRNLGRAMARTREINLVARTADRYEKAFIATAKIPTRVNQIKLATQNAAAAFNRAYAGELTSVFGASTKAERKSLMDAYRGGHIAGSVLEGGRSVIGSGGPVGNLGKYFVDAVDGAAMTIKTAGLTAGEINRYLPKSWGIINGKTMNESDTAWLHEFLKKASNGTNNGAAPLKAIHGIHQDPADVLFQLTSAVNKAQAVREMNITIANAFGVSAAAKGAKGTTETGAQFSKELESKYGWQKVAGLGDNLFDPATAAGIRQMQQIIETPKLMDGYIRSVDTANGVLKSLLTRYNPGFHVNTLMGETFMTHMGGVSVAKYSMKSKAVLRGRSRELLGGGKGVLGEFGSTLSRAEISRANMLNLGGARNVASVASKGSVGSTSMKLGDHSYTYDELWSLYNATGLKSGLLTEELTKEILPAGKGGAFGTSAAGKATKRGQAAVQGLTEGIEDFSRMTHFIGALAMHSKHGKSNAINLAAQDVRKYHLDYTNVTYFERSFAARGMLFYKWLRLSTPLMMQHLVTRPGKISTVSDITTTGIPGLAGYDVSNGRTNSDVLMPKFMQEGGGIPVGNFFGLAGDDTVYINQSVLNPFSGSVNTIGKYIPDDMGGSGTRGIASPLAATFDQVTPLIRTPTESAFGRTSYGAELKGDSGVIKNVIGAVPQGSFVRDLVLPRDDSISRGERSTKFAFNIGQFTNTTRMQANEARRRQDAATVARQVAKKAKEGK